MNLEQWKASPDTEDGDGSWEVGYVSTRGLPVLLAYGLTEAKAHLIAAAPDLLAALKGVLDPNDLDFPDDLRPEWKAVVAAIAKAEGRTE